MEKHISFFQKRRLIYYEFFQTEKEFARKYVLNLLNPNQNYRSRCLSQGHKIEIENKKKYFKILKDRNVRVLGKFNYLEDDLDDVPLDDVLASKSDDELSDLFYAHNEKLFKRSNLAHCVIEPLFVKKNFKLVLTKYLKLLFLHKEVNKFKFQLGKGRFRITQSRYRTSFFGGGS